MQLYRKLQEYNNTRKYCLYIKETALGTATRVENCPHNGDEYELQISGHVFMIIWNLLFYTYKTKMGSFFEDICLVATSI